MSHILRYESPYANTAQEKISVYYAYHMTKVQKKHKPIKASFDEVLKGIATSSKKKVNKRKK